MKFLPVKERNMTMLMRLPARRLSLKAYIEKSMIPDIIEHEGSEFLSSLFFGYPAFRLRSLQQRLGTVRSGASI